MSLEDTISNYRKLVDDLTSEAGKDTYVLYNRLKDLQEQGFEPTRLLMSSIGMTSESGELLDLVKKVTFHDKPVNDEVLLHMKKELGDVLWYLINACIALNVDFVDVLNENTAKLSKRYPDGKFSVEHSVNRKKGDV